MKYNENKFADAVLLKLHPIVNVFLVGFEQLPCKHRELKTSEVNAVLTSWLWNNIELSLFQPPMFSGYLFE